MKNYYLSKVKYVKINETGKEQKVTEEYLLDAVSFTECESRTYEEMEKLVSGDFVITNESKSNISEVFRNPDGDRFFKAKVTFASIDEASGKEKKVTEYMLVEAETVEDAYVFLTSALSDMIVPFEIPSISESKILDVFEYDLEMPIKSTKGKVIVDYPSDRGEKFSQVNDQMKIGVDIANGKDMTGFPEYSKARLESE